MFVGDPRLAGMIVEDCSDIRETLADALTTFFDVRIVHQAWSNAQAMEYVERLSQTWGPLDFIVTDINRPSGSGVDLIRGLRSLPDSYTTSKCLRARRVPIVVHSGGGLNPANARAIAAIDPSIPMLVKWAGIDSILRAIDSAVGQYRYRLLSELQRVGLCIYWQAGTYRVAGAYNPRRGQESEYIAGDPHSVAQEYTRLLLFADHGASSLVTLRSFEDLLNDPKTMERDLQRFFQEHPEFLLADQYDSYWAEPRLKSAVDGRRIRPDFVLQPISRRARPSDWCIVDLKRHDVPLLSHERFHRDLSHQVYRAATQVRDYHEFFSDHRNHELVCRKFGGVVPSPQLCVVIGQLPPHAGEAFGRLRERIPDVSVRTYDEILELRRAKVERIQRLWR